MQHGEGNASDQRRLHSSALAARGNASLQTSKDEAAEHDFFRDATGQDSRRHESQNFTGAVHHERQM